MTRMTRVSTTSDTTGKVVRAMLQEADIFDNYGNIHWQDVRPLPITQEGSKVTITLYPKNPEEDKKP